MAVPATKRRKTEHVSSDDDSEASFASFGDDADQTEDADAGASADDEEMEEEELDAADEDEDGEDAAEDDEENTATTKHTAVSKPVPQQNGSKPSQAAKTSAAYASGTFKSNVFKLQVDELLGQIRPRKSKREAAAEAALHGLKKSIEQIPPRGPHTLVDAERELIKQKVAVPFPDPRPPKDAKYKFAYAKPSNINVVGSLPLKTTSRTQEVPEVDMVAVIPSSLFEEKDYLNHRYFYKRAYYLACIAAGLKSAHKNEFSLRFKLMHDDPLKPILVVSPVEASSKSDTPAPKWRVNIIPCISRDQFSAEKLRPERNCIRYQDTQNGQDATQVPTPSYNSSLRSDMLMIEYLKFLHGASKRCHAFIDASLLGATWLRQRGFGSSIATGGFGNFEWKALMALCLQGGGPNGKPLLSDGYSSYQLFKATLQLLAMKDFAKHPLVFGEASSGPKMSTTPIAWNTTNGHNVLYKVPKWSYGLLRREAKTTITTLGDQLHDGFDATFIMRVQEPLYRFDQVVHIPERSLLGKSGSTDQPLQQRLDKLYDVLHEGLGDRATQVSITRGCPALWELGSSRPKEGTRGDVQIGLMINSDNAKRTVDHGPSAEEKAASAAFRNFWGEKSELRRFKDGSILESLVWATPQESGMSVLEQIVRYLLGHHFGLVTLDDITFFGDSFSKLVRAGSERTVFEPIIERYKQFENDLRELRDLPLTVRQIMPADPQLRYGAVRPPSHGKNLQTSTPADVTIQFEGSGRWPDDLVAIQRTKIAFLLKINDMLQESVDGITSRIGLENEGQGVLNQGFLDVTYDADATFRLRIYHEREQTLHERKLKDKTADPRSREVAAAGLAKYKRDYIKTPAHTQAISRLCSRFSALSGSIRLTKRWFASHLLSNHIAEEVIELLVIRTFTQPWPWQAPASVQTGFLRTLFWISRWDWRAEPLIVDLSAGGGDLKQADVQAITTNFDAWRKLDPQMNRVALFAVSNVDRDGTTYTDGQPAKVVAGRMSALAKAAYAEVAEKHLALEPAALFSSPLTDFHFVLHLAGDGKSKKRNSTGTAYKNLEIEAVSDVEMIGFEPEKDLLKDLEATYGASIIFFTGGSERAGSGAVIAGLWSPLTARRSWKVNLAYSTIPTKMSKGEEEDVDAVLNKAAILAEIARLGGDMIEKIEVFEK
ncbi:U3 small nucleolar RNA-associated protein 22 [Fulvia fulva]|nr:U3 small nucleolar RNA-associated protein 22 [Fulvia fulva]KAK4612440.1 U3 small nucleolar RNA-associated protein 22 [Fulvia fulva]WPV20849.1 U3 small nucleolar RNA-associated protein 22 [Fulvia fulva]